MGFVEFKGKRGKFTPQVTINKSGGFGLSSGMHHRFGLDKYNSVRLYYDQENRTIGIKLFEIEGEGVFRLKKRPNEKGAYFVAKSFTEAYQIGPGRFSPEIVNDSVFGEMFVVNPNEKPN